MKVHGLNHFSGFHSLPPGGRERREALDALGFFEGLQNHVPVADVTRGTDPPDFVICIEGRKIGAELTRLNPKVFGHGGCAKMAEFKRWKGEIEDDLSAERQFSWGGFTLRESLAAFDSQVRRKTTRALSFAPNYDEVWLIFQAESGSPASGLVARKFSHDRGLNDRVLDFAGKHLLEMERICQTAAPYTCVILFSGPHLLAYSRGKELHGLPGPDIELLQRGGRASDDFLDWRAEFFSVSNRSGDVVLWRDITRISSPHAK